MERDLALADTCRHLEAGVSLKSPLERMSDLGRAALARMGIRNAGPAPARSERSPVAAVVLVAPLLGACLWAALIHLVGTVL